MEGVADGVGGLAGGVLDGSDSLVYETFALKLVVSGELACAFLDLATRLPPVPMTHCLVPQAPVFLTASSTSSLVLAYWV